MLRFAESHLREEDVPFVVESSECGDPLPLAEETTRTNHPAWRIRHQLSPPQLEDLAREPLGGAGE